MDNRQKEKKVGEFLVEYGIISRQQLDESLLMQRDNPERLIGEILVTQGVISKEELIMALEMYLMTSGNEAIHVDEWLDQEEVDMLIDKIKEQSRS